MAVGTAAGGSLAGSGTVASGSARRIGAFREPLLGLGLLIVALAAAFAVRQVTATRADSLTRPGATATLIQAPVGIVAIRSIPAPGPLKLAPVHAHKARPTVSHPPAVAPAPAIHRVVARARSAPAVSAPVESTGSTGSGSPAPRQTTGSAGSGSTATGGDGTSSGAGNSTAAGGTSSNSADSGSGYATGGSGTSGGSGGSGGGTSGNGTGTASGGG